MSLSSKYTSTKMEKKASEIQKWRVWPQAALVTRKGFSQQSFAGWTLMGDCEAEKLEGIQRSRMFQTHLKAMLKMLFAAVWALQQESWEVKKTIEQ